MANPDFPGSVSRYRCETCFLWARIAGGATIGECKYVFKTIPYDPKDFTQRPIAYTTDLTVCSDWTPKED